VSPSRSIPLFSKLRLQYAQVDPSSMSSIELSPSAHMSFERTFCYGSGIGSSFGSGANSSYFTSSTFCSAPSSALVTASASLIFFNNYNYF